MSGTLLDVAALLDRVVYSGLGLVLCQEGERVYEREASITSLSVLALPWVCRRHTRLRDGSANSSAHATRLEALRMVAEAIGPRRGWRSVRASTLARHNTSAFISTCQEAQQPSKQIMPLNSTLAMATNQM